MSIFTTAANRLGIVGEVLSFFARNKRVWLLPMIAVVLLTGIVVLLAESSAIVPFIYALF